MAATMGDAIEEERLAPGLNSPDEICGDEYVEAFDKGAQSNLRHGAFEQPAGEQKDATFQLGDARQDGFFREKLAQISAAQLKNWYVRGVRNRQCCRLV
ncbi:MAG TPA: hypothetical protein PK585_00080 [Amphiplicatus sp.]|nr:hypothetical protein [Amphiplicatus sp.]